MPQYNTNNSITLQYESLASPPTLDGGVPTAAFNDENVTVGEISQQYALPFNHTGQMKPISAFLKFDAAPGTFEIDILTADEDVESEYTEIQKISAVNTSNQARIEFLTAAKFIAVQVVALANAVKTTVKLTRHY